MRVLSLVQALFAIGFLLFGLVALFGIGITGLFIMVCGLVFAGTASVTEQPSRAGVALALAADAVLAYFAARHLAALDGALPLRESLPAAAILALIALGLLAVLFDWRQVRAARWF